MDSDYYRPIVNLSFLLDATIGGQDPFYYRLTNLFLHAIFLMIFLRLLRSLGIDKKLALLATVIMAVHPLVLNSVVWIVGRNDIIYSIFGAGSLLFFIRYIKTKTQQNLFVHIILYFLSVFSKETALVMPVIFIATYWLLTKEKLDFNKLIFPIFAWITVIVIFFLIRSNADLGDAVYGSGLDVFIYNIGMIPEILAKFFMPWETSVLPTYSGILPWIGLIAILALVGINYTRTKQLRNVSWLGLIIFLVLLFPAMFVQLLNFNNWNDYLECRAYLPIAGLIIFLMFILQSFGLNLKNKAILVVSILLAISLVFLNHAKAPMYSNEVEYYEEAVEQDDSRALFNSILANIYQSEGKTEEAELLYSQACKANPNYPKTHIVYAKQLIRQNRHLEALPLIEHAYELEPENQEANSSYFIILHILGDTAKSFNLMEKYIEKWPDDHTNVNNIFNLYLSLGKVDDARIIEAVILKNGGNNEYLSEVYGKWSKVMFSKGYVKIGSAYSHRAYDFDSTNKAPNAYLFDFYYYNEKDYKKAAFYADRIIDLGGKIQKDKMKKLKQYMVAK
jgi:protein O-mannosyl-transferase